jgi:hypothetical protein
MIQKRVPGAPLLIHKMLEGRYRHHHALLQAARRHSGLPPPSHPKHPQPVPAPTCETMESEPAPEPQIPPAALAAADGKG